MSCQMAMVSSSASSSSVLSSPSLPPPSLSSAALSLSTSDSLLLIDALLHFLSQSSAPFSSIALADVDWSSIASLLSSKQFPLSSPLDPSSLSSQLQFLLSSSSPVISPSSPISVSSLVSLSTALRQRRLVQLKEEMASAVVRQRYLESQELQQLQSMSSLSQSSLFSSPVKAEPMTSAPTSSLSSLTSPLLMSPLQRSVQQKSSLPSTPLPSTAASIASLPTLDPSPPPAEGFAGEGDEVQQSPQPPQQLPLPGGRWKRGGAGEDAMKALAATPPPPLRRTITDMELEPTSSAVEDIAAPLPYTTNTALEEDNRLPASSFFAASSSPSSSSPPVPSSLPPLDTSTSSSFTAPSQMPSTAPSTTSSSPSSSSSPSVLGSRALSPHSMAEVLLEILSVLQAHPDAEPFLLPVSKEEVPGYYDTIKHPMDFSTIQKDIVDGKCNSPQDFHRQLLLVFSNAYTYNDRKTTFYKMAKSHQPAHADTHTPTQRPPSALLPLTFSLRFSLCPALLL